MNLNLKTANKQKLWSSAKTGRARELQPQNAKFGKIRRKKWISVAQNSKKQRKTTKKGRNIEDEKENSYQEERSEVRGCRSESLRL